MKVPEAEQDVLAVLYELGSATARELRERLSSRRPLAHASVVTLLGRLENKGLVRKRKADSGKAFVFSPTRPPFRTFGPVLTRLFTRAFQGNTATLMATLFESRPPDAREIEELERLLDRWRERKEKRP
jgi:predicted transcriptional regulator